MPKNKIIITLGFLIAILPFLGFPHSWDNFFQIIFGLSIILLSVLISFDRRLSMKAKMQKRQARKRAMINEVVPPNEYGVFGRRASDVAPGSAPFVRRTSDRQPPDITNNEA